MTTDDIWKLIRKYGNLVELDQAKPFLCPDCGERFVWMNDQHADPVLFCAFEGTTAKPGMDFFDDVKAVVSEFYVEN